MKEIVIGESESFITGDQAVDSFKKTVKNFVESREALSFGYPSGSRKHYTSIDEMPFPLHIMSDDAAEVIDVWKVVGFGGEPKNNEGHYSGVKLITNHISDNSYKFPINIWNMSEYGSSVPT